MALHFVRFVRLSIFSGVQDCYPLVLFPSIPFAFQIKKELLLVIILFTIFFLDLNFHRLSFKMRLASFAFL